jgi:hypothetical protein
MNRFPGRRSSWIQSGTHLGPYEILSAIGACGMREFYGARDPKLGRSHQGSVRSVWPRC